VACTAVAPLAAGVALPDVLLTATIVLAGVFAAAAALRRLRVLADCGKPDAVAGILVAATAGAAVVISTASSAQPAVNARLMR